MKLFSWIDTFLETWAMNISGASKSEIERVRDDRCKK